MKNFEQRIKEMQERLRQQMNDSFYDAYGNEFYNNSKKCGAVEISLKHDYKKPTPLYSERFLNERCTTLTETKIVHTVPKEPVTFRGFAMWWHSRLKSFNLPPKLIRCTQLSFSTSATI